MKISEYIKKYLKSLEVNRRSPATVKTYSWRLGKFSQFMGDVEPEAITVAKVEEFKEKVNGDLNMYLISLRGFLKYLAKNDVEAMSKDKVELVPTVEPENHSLDEKEIEQLLDFKTKTIRQKRDKAILQTFLSSGLRLSELCNLKRDQVNLEDMKFTIRGKGGVLRKVRLNSKASELIKDYLKVRRDDCEYLFIANRTTNPSKMAPRSVQRLVRRNGERVGLKETLHPHKLRRTFCTVQQKYVKDVTKVQRYMGHKRIATTLRYIDISEPELDQSFYQGI